MEEITPAGLPAIGKWMIAPDSAPAHWLNEIYNGKHLREPINIIIYDPAAKSGAEARTRLLRALTAAGFPARAGHSGGYFALIGGSRYGQLTSGNLGTFSDGPFEFNNDHGRIFGPLPYQSGYLWIAAFSRERIAPFAEVKHEYVSFNQSRDKLALDMEMKTPFRRTRYVSLENTLIADSSHTTGDHDGIAVMLEARE